ncbi:MAG: bifunctional oligoribonuclease/PAP phosphatase NrnA [Bacilli bacterium]|nr:bifunctional oligoribonuclease/PAP phosphatase NrnA [Bacilli bacterium]
MFEKLKSIIEEHNSIVIFGHKDPDGDCYGSQYALREIIKLNYPNKKVYAVGSGLRRFQRYIGRLDVIDDVVIDHSLAILVDGNDLYRMEDQRVWNAKAFIKIDHHVENGRFTQGEFVLNEHANSTCQLITQMVMESGWKINPNIADALYLGIVTDTGRFQYIEDFPKTFKEVAWLCEQGAQPKKINELLNITYENSLAFKAYAYTHYQKSEHGTIYLALDNKTLTKFHLNASQGSNMVNLLSNIQGYPVWVFFAETENGFAHIEFRSNGPLVQPIAKKIGGGGHMLASGVTVPEFNDKMIKEVVDLCDEAIIEYQKEN